MSTLSRNDWFLDEDPDDVGIHVDVRIDGTTSISFTHGDHTPLDEFAITGPTEAVMGVISRMYLRLKAETKKVGPVCCLCEKRGVVGGSFPIPAGTRHVHPGCAQDEERDRARHLAAVPD